MKITLQAVIVTFICNDKHYYTIITYDSGISTATNLDNAKKSIEGAILAQRLLECHDAVTLERMYVNFKEFKTASVLESKVVEFTAEA